MGKLVPCQLFKWDGDLVNQKIHGILIVIIIILFSQYSIQPIILFPLFNVGSLETVVLLNNHSLAVVLAALVVIHKRSEPSVYCSI